MRPAAIGIVENQNPEALMQASTEGALTSRALQYRYASMYYGGTVTVLLILQSPLTSESLMSCSPFGRFLIIIIV